MELNSFPFIQLNLLLRHGKVWDQWARDFLQDMFHFENVNKM